MENIFFGRKQYIDILEKRILGLKEGYHQNIAIIGDELTGKTSIVFNILNKLYDNRILLLYLEIRPEPLDCLVKKFIGVLLYNFLNNTEISIKEDLDFLIKKSSKYIPKTIEKIKHILSVLNKKHKDNVFTEMLSLCEIVNQETGKFCVIIWDEFQNLEQIRVKNIYREWAKVLILQKNTMYIILSSMKFKAKNILSKDLSLLFGNFEIIDVEPFTINESEAYLRQKLHEKKINSGLNNFIVNFTGGYPFYLKVIANALSKSEETNLVSILEDLLFDSSGILNQRFSSYLKRFLDSTHNQDYSSILYLISTGHNKLKDIAHILHKPQKELNLRINHLLEFDAISRNGDFLKINDRVLSFWLKFVYRKKIQAFTFDAKNQKASFRENIAEMIQEFLLNTSKPIIERIMELLHLFQDEKIQIERKRLTLSHFREIKPLEFSKANLREGLICRSHDSLWIMALKHDLLTEEDVTEFAEECKKYRHKLQKKIIVAFKDIEANAQLRALEEKIWTWDINNLNQILDLFYKPRVIV